MAEWTKEMLKNAAMHNMTLPDDAGYKAFSDLDGMEAAWYLAGKGFKVVKVTYNGKFGAAVTECGIALSTQGFIWRTKVEEKGIETEYGDIIPSKAQLMDGISYVYDDNGKLLGAVQWEHNLVTGDFKQVYLDSHTYRRYKRERIKDIWGEWYEV